MSEAAYKKELDTVAAEIYEGIYVHHVMEEINRLALSDMNILRAMNEQVRVSRRSDQSGAIGQLPQRGLSRLAAFLAAAKPA